MSQRWNPWRHLSRRYPHVAVACIYSLPGRHKGLLTAGGIYLDCHLTQTGRRCTLTHEIVHLERGPVGDHPHFRALEEHAVEVVTAARLVTVEALLSALLWTRHLGELAEELWVTECVARTRIAHLTARERAHITHELARRQPWTT